MARCKIEYKQGFNETKKNLYNNYINFLFGESIIDASKEGFFVSIGSKIGKNDSDILYRSVEDKIWNNIFDSFEEFINTVDLTEEEEKSFENLDEPSLEEISNFYINFKGSKKERQKIERQLDLIYIYNNFNSFISYNVLKSKLSIEEGVNEKNEENEDSSKPNKFKDTISESVWDRGDFFIRNLFLTIPQINKKGEIVIDKQTGLPIMADGVNLFNNLSIDLADSTDAEFFYKKLNSTKIKNKYPELSYLNKLFPDTSKKYSNINDIAAAQFKIAFYQTLNKSFIPLAGLIIKENEIYSKLLLANRDMVVKGRWSNNFQTQDLKNNKYVKEIDGERTLIQAPTLDKKDAESIRKYLSYLGIELDPNILTGKINKKGEVEDILFGGKKYGKGLVSVLSDYFRIFISEGRGVTDFMEYFREPKEENKSDKGHFSRIGAQLRALIKLEGEYSTLQVALTHNNANGDQQSTISERNSFTIILNILNNSKNISEVYEKLPILEKNIQFQKGSFWYDSLFDENGDRYIDHKIEISNYSGIENRIDPSLSKSTSKMNQREKLLFDLNMILGNKTFIDLPRTSTSDTYFAITLPKNNFSQKEFQELMINYLYKEFDAIKSGKTKNHFIFQVDEKIVNGKIITNSIISQKALDEAKKGNYELALLDIDKYFIRHLNSLKRGLNKLNISPGDQEAKVITKNLIFKEGKEITEKDIKEGDEYGIITREQVFDDKKLITFLQRHFINSVEAAYLFTGNPNNFKDFTKRFKGGLSTGIPMDSSKDIEIILNNPEIEGNQYSIRNLLGKKERRSNDTSFATKTFEDAYVENNNTYKNLLSKTNLSEKVLSPYKYDEKTGKGINKADGQSLINLDFYREFLMRTGNWSDQKEDTVIYEGLYFKKNLLGIKLSKLEQDRFDSLEEDINNSSGEYSLPPIKAQYNGPYANLDTQELSMDKTSMVPILPSLAHQTGNKQWIKLLKDMALNDIAYVKYESVAKGYINKKVSFGEALNDPDLHYPIFLKEQIRTASYLKELVTWGTQFRKLLFAGLFDNGTASPKIKGLYSDYINLLKSVALDAKETLAKDLGLELDLENKKITITNYKKLVEKLQDQAQKLNLSSSVIDAIAYNPETGELLNAFETTGATSVVTNMLFGMIDKKLRAWKTVGNQYIQVSNDTFENLKFYDLVKETNKTSKAQIRITLTGEFKKLLKLSYKGKVIKDIQTLNKALKNKTWRLEHEKHLTVIAYRIPTQDINSMEYLEIVEFLTPTAGNIIQLYDEITAKSGADFDIDKLSVFLPSFDENGEYLDYRDGEDLYETYRSLLVLKQAKKYDVRRHVNNKLQELKEDSKVLRDNIKLIKDSLFVLKAERDYYLEEIQYAYSLKQQEEDEDIVLSESSKKSIDALINSLFSLDGSENLNLDSIIIENKEFYFTKLREIQETYIELSNIKNEKYFTQDSLKALRESHLNLEDNLEPYYAEMFERSDNIRKALYRLRSKKNILTNKLIEIYSEIFQQPESFEQLVRPNDASLVNDIFEENFKNDPDNIGKALPRGLPSGSTVFSYLTNLDLHARLKLAGRHLGIYAVANTSHALATQNGLNINPYYINRYWRVDKDTGEEELIEESKQVQLSLLTEKEKEVIRNSDGTINMGLNFDSEGQSIQNILTKLIDVTVDSEKNPQYLFANINNSNISLVLYLLRQQVPFKRIIQFISLPDNKAYFKDKELGIKPKPVPPNMDKVLSLNDYGIAELEERLKKAPSQRDGTDLDFYQKSLQILVRLEKEASLFTEFTQHFNYDTSKINTPIALVEKDNNTRKIKQSSFITTETLNTWMEDSIVARFNNTDLIKSISQQILPILFKEDLVDNFVKTLSLTKLTAIQRVNLEKIILQEYIQAIYEHFGTYKDTSIGEYGNELLSDNELYKTFRKYAKELPEFSIFKQITSEKVPGQDIYNLRIIRDINNKAQQVNILSQELEKLMNYEESENEDENLEIQEMAKDLSIIAMKQGFSKSRFYMEDIVPLSFKQDLYTSAIENYLAFQDPSNIIPLLEGPMENNFEYFYTEFEKKFIQNYKTKYFPTLKSSFRDYDIDPGEQFTQNPLGNRVNDYTFDPLFNVLTDEERKAAEDFNEQRRIQIEEKRKQREARKAKRKANNKENASDILSKLGDKTQSENVKLPEDLDLKYEGVNFWKEIVPEARAMWENEANPIIIAFRGNKNKSFLENYESNTIGNPFDWQKYGVEKATLLFIDWMITGNNHSELNATSEYREAIINDIKSGKWKNTTILYYQELDRPTHATALDYLINKHSWDGQRKNYSDKVDIISEEGKEVEGAFISKNTLSQEQQLEIFNYLQPYIETQGKRTNMGLKAPIMIGLGLRWDYKRNNPGKTPVTIGPNLAGGNTSYAYYDESINGLPLAPIPDFIKDHVTNLLDLNISDYDGAIINVYGEGSLIGNHSDLEESIDAKNRPVTVLNIGGNGNIILGNNINQVKKAFEAGSAYTFGVEGVNRTIPHSTYTNEIKGFLPELYIAQENMTLPAGSYRITVTLRKVLPNNIKKDSSNNEVEENIIRFNPNNIDFSNVPKKVSRGYQKFYSRNKDNNPVMRYGKPIKVDGFEDISLMMEQNSKEIYETTTGFMVPSHFLGKAIEKERLKEAKNLFTKKDVRSVLASTDKIDFNTPENLSIEVEQKNPIFAESVEIDKNKLNNCKYGL